MNSYQKRSVLPSALCAFISLLESILEDPRQPQARVDTTLLSDFVQVLVRLNRDKECDLKSLLDGCQVMESIAKNATTTAAQSEAYTPSKKEQVSNILLPTDAVQLLNNDPLRQYLLCCHHALTRCI